MWGVMDLDLIVLKLDLLRAGNKSPLSGKKLSDLSTKEVPLGFWFDTRLGQSVLGF